MFRYSCFGLTIDSELELFAAPVVCAGEPDVLIRLAPVERSAGKRTTMNEEFAFNTLGGGFQIKNGREIRVDPLPAAGPDVLSGLLLGKMMAFLLRQRGWLPLHASGVSIDGRAALFLGPSGSGKSTIAAAFHARGHEVIADDVAAVKASEGRCDVRGASSRVRLLDDALIVFGAAVPKSVFQYDKQVFDLTKGKPPRLLPVEQIYFLEYGKEIRTESLPPLSAIPLLSSYSFVKRPRLDREALGAHLKDCSSVAGTTHVRRLIRPRSIDALPGSVRCVEEEMAANGRFA